MYSIVIELHLTFYIYFVYQQTKKNIVTFVMQKATTENLKINIKMQTREK